MAEAVDAMQADPKIDFFDFFSIHERFHRRIAECAGCNPLSDAIAKTNTLIRTWQYAAISDYRDMPPHFHAALVDELGAGDPERADRVMRQHVRHGMDEVLRRIERFLSGELAAPAARQ